MSLMPLSGTAAGKHGPNLRDYLTLTKNLSVARLQARGTSKWFIHISMTSSAGMLLPSGFASPVSVDTACQHGRGPDHSFRGVLSVAVRRIMMPSLVLVEYILRQAVDLI